MQIEVFSDLAMPDDVIQFAVQGKNRRSNTRTRNQGGFADATVIWQDTLREYVFGIVPMPREQWDTLAAIFEITHGGAYGFLLADPSDSKVGDAGVLIVDPLLAGVFRTAKRYVAAGSSRYKDRYVTRPTAAGFSITRGGTPVTVGGAPGQVAINFDTGRVTFVADATSTVTAVAVGTTTDVTLTGAIPGLVIGGSMFLSGLAGADAALLNGKYHEISNVAGAVYTLLINTVGKTITAGAGVGAKYPQPGEALEWEGDFSVPVQFAMDEIDWTIVAAGAPDERLMSGPSVQLVEVREA